MGTILHKGEYILLSNVITNKSRYMGYALLSHIGIKVSKVNYIGSTKHFKTFAVIEDLELPFNTTEWQDFEVRSVRFHAYTKKFKNLILLEHDEFQLDYLDEVDEFFEKKEKEDKTMTIEANNYIYIASNTIGSSDNQLISALFGYVPTCTKYENIHGDDLLWSRTKFLHERSFVFNDAERRLHERDKKLDFVMTEKGDVIIYRDTNDDKRQRIFIAYNEYSKKDEPTLNTDSSFSLHCKPFITMPRNLGRSQAMSMLNSFYGLNPSFQAGLLRWGDWDSGFKLYFGVERATGKQKTVCLWKDGEKTIIRGDKSVLSMPVQYAVAWCYVKRRFKTTSQFKKYVDDRSFVMDGMTYFEGDARVKGAQASVNNRTKKYDIYDAAALAITAKHYGSVKTIMAYCDGWGE